MSSSPQADEGLEGHGRQPASTDQQQADPISSPPAWLLSNNRVAPNPPMTPKTPTTPTGLADSGEPSSEGVQPQYPENSKYTTPTGLADTGEPSSEGVQPQYPENSKFLKPQAALTFKNLVGISSDKDKQARVTALLNEFDHDGNGKIDPRELVNLVESMAKERAEAKLIRRIIWIQAVASLAMLAAIVGLTWAVLIYSKDYKIESGAMLDKRTGRPLMTSSYEIGIVDGVFAAKVASMTDSLNNISTAETPASGGSNATNATMPLRVAATTIPAKLSSKLPMSVLQELKYIQVNSTNGAELSLLVLAIAKMPAPFTSSAARQQGYGSGPLYTSCGVVRIVTYVGTIVVHGDQLEFEEGVTHVFRDAGFLVDASGRRLLGIYDIIGFFNFIATNLEIYNLPPTEPKPHLPQNFTMKIKQLEPCVPSNSYGVALTDNSAVDRCKNTVSGKDLPGVELINGVRMMSSTQTVSRQSNMILTVTKYAAYEGMVKKEILNEATGKLYSWQDVRGRPIKCTVENYTDDWQEMTPLKDKGLVNFTFLGYEEKLGVPARHFKLTIQQSSVLHPEAHINNTVYVDTTVDYWDTADKADDCSYGKTNNYPVAFEFLHPDIGAVAIYVVSLMAGAVTASSSFALPVTDFGNSLQCPEGSVPRMVSPFDQPAWVAPESDETLAALIGVGPVSDEGAVIDDIGSFAVTNGTLASTRKLLAVKKYGASFAMCDWKYGLENNNLVEFTASCSGNIPATPVVLTGAVSMRTICQWSSCYMEYGGKLSVGVGLGRIPIATVRKLLNKYLLNCDDCLDGLVIEVMSVELKYDTRSKLGVIEGHAYLPSIQVIKVDWAVSANTNFKDCLKAKDVSVSVKVDVNVVFWSFKQTLGSYSFYEGRGC